MNLRSLTIDGFGVWSDLEVRGLDNGVDETPEKVAGGLKVLFGPNEAGKTTLLQFIRSALYGFSPARRHYLPPIHGGDWGGRLEINTQDGLLELRRHLHVDEDGTERDQLALVDEDGTPRTETDVALLPGDVDEGVFQNVFAVGLREIQELGTLSDSQAADQLYSLSVGLDRVSLVDVMRRLREARERLIGSDDTVDGESATIGGEIPRLLQRRAQLAAEIAQLSDATRRYARLAAEHDELGREIQRLQQQQSETDQLAREVELAITLRQRWQRSLELDEQLSLLPAPESVPTGAVERLDGLIARQRKHEQAARECLAQRRALRDEAAATPIRKTLWRHAPRIEALEEQLSWIQSLQDEVGQMTSEVDGLEARLGRERQSLGLSETAATDEWQDGEGDQSRWRSRRPAHLLRRLRPHARALRDRVEQLRAVRRKVDECAQRRDDARRTMDQRLAGRGEDELTREIDAVGGRVAQLRRRLQVDERLDELSRHQTELQEQNRELVDRQVLPMWVLMALGAGFALGVFLIMLGLLISGSLFSTLGWALAGLGLGGAAAAGAWKFLLERANERQLASCQQQLTMLQSQLRQTNDERDLLDRQIPAGGGPLASRLQSAEQQLAELETLMPLKAQRDNAEQSLTAAQRERAEAEGDLAAARRTWAQALRQFGLPGGLSPRKLRQALDGLGELDDLQSELKRRREALDARRRELDSLTRRIDQLAAECEVTVDGPPTARLTTLAGMIEQQRGRIDRRRELAREDRRLRSRQRKHRDMIGRLAHSAAALLIATGVTDEQQLRERAVQAARAEVLRGEGDGLRREIDAAIEGTCSIERLSEHLDAAADHPKGESLEARRDGLLGTLEQLEGSLSERLEQRGRTAERMRTLADDRQLAGKQLEEASVEARLRRATHRWKVLTVVGRLLDEIRRTYEQERQPATLQEASGYLTSLTEGRYTRVWTPLDEDVLRVDDRDGNPLPVEMLSRGTREQLFLALRLSLATSYAQRGIRMPMVLDDVLVNFDAQRAKAAVTVLRDFAEQGFQLLVFTCHDHIAKLFRARKVPTRELPSSRQAGPEPVVFGPDEKRPGGPAIPIHPLASQAPQEATTEAAATDQTATEPPEEPQAETAPKAAPADVIAPPLEGPPAQSNERPNDRIFNADFFIDAGAANVRGPSPHETDDGFFEPAETPEQSEPWDEDEEDVDDAQADASRSDTPQSDDEPIDEEDEDELIDEEEDEDEAAEEEDGDDEQEPYDEESEDEEDWDEDEWEEEEDEDAEWEEEENADGASDEDDLEASDEDNVETDDEDDSEASDEEDEDAEAHQEDETAEDDSDEAPSEETEEEEDLWEEDEDDGYEPYDEEFEAEQLEEEEDDEGEDEEEWTEDESGGDDDPDRSAEAA